MDPAVNAEWTSSEVEEARSLIARLNSNNIIDNNDKNKKHDDIVDALHALFPSNTMKQVTDLYIDLVVEMHMMQQREESHVARGNTHNVCTVPNLVNCNFGDLEESGASGAHVDCTMDDLLNAYNFGVQEEGATMDATVSVFGHPLEHTKIMEMEEAPQMVEKNNMEVLENNIANDKPVVSPHSEGLWTDEEHRQFLRGLRIYGRGDWKNISRHFVTTRTAIQVSSHAQKYFIRLKKQTLSGRAGRQHYSINDVGLHDDDPLTVENTPGSYHGPTFTGNNEPSFESQAQTSSGMMNSQDQFWSPMIYDQQVGQQPMWSGQQMMGSAAALMEEIGNFVPACQQISSYLSPGQCMNGMH
uniref:Uncharacterized protein n=1 Tax=Avena sativa TaxID=4498 RepID=A0ACD5XXI5_AVESA